jgi:plastocyanin
MHKYYFLVNPNMKIMSVTLCAILGVAIVAGVSFFAFSQVTSAQIGSMSTLQNIPATYAVSIIPGAAQKTSPYHYYPPNIAVPAGTVVAWFNNDLGQPHTVTSGIPGASDAGKVFNSGIMPATANSFFQYGFTRAGDFTYHCEIHPWRVAKVSVSSAIEQEQGQYFKYSSGVGPAWDLAKNPRTLLDFTPLTISLDRSTPIVYNVTILKNNTEKVFSGKFVTNGESLPLELVKGVNETRVYGPDFSSTGAYHLEGPFFKDNADYKILISIPLINSKPPKNPIAEEFSIKTVSSS